MTIPNSITTTCCQLVADLLKPVHTVAEKCDSRRIRRLSPLSGLAVFSDSRTFLRQCGHCMDRALATRRTILTFCRVVNRSSPSWELPRLRVNYGETRPWIVFCLLPTMYRWAEPYRFCSIKCEAKRDRRPSLSCPDVAELDRLD